MKSNYVRATLEFCDYVLGDLSGLNLIFQSNAFQLHRFVPEVERVIKALCLNFRKPIGSLASVDVDDEFFWLPLETITKMLPHEREFPQKMERLVQGGSATDSIEGQHVLPVLNAVNDVNHKLVTNGSAEIGSAGLLAKRFLKFVLESAQTIDREWR